MCTQVGYATGSIGRDTLSNQRSFIGGSFNRKHDGEDFGMGNMDLVSINIREGLRMKEIEHYQRRAQRKINLGLIKYRLLFMCIRYRNCLKVNQR